MVFELNEMQARLVSRTRLMHDTAFEYSQAWEHLLRVLLRGRTELRVVTRKSVPEDKLTFIFGGAFFICF